MRESSDLTDWLSAQLPTDVQLVARYPLHTAGTVNEVERVDVRTPCGSRSFILRRPLPVALPGCLPVRVQARLMSAIAGSDTGSSAVPASVGCFADALVLPLIEGSSAPRCISSAEHPALTSDLGRALRHIHTSVSDPAAKLPTWQEQSVLLLEACHHESASQAFEQACELVSRWQYADVLLHGDFRTGNYLARPGEAARDEGKARGFPQMPSDVPQQRMERLCLSAVLDFDLAMTGPALLDLGWLSASCWRYAGPDRPVGGVGQWSDFLQGYGQEYPDGRIAEAQRWAIARWAVIADIQGQRGRALGRPDMIADGEAVDQILDLFVVT